MVLLILGLIVFFGIHLVPVVPGARANAVQAIGEMPFKIAFSIASVLGLVLIIWGYGAAQNANVILWEPPVWTRHLATLFMLFAMIAIAAAYVPSRIRDVLRHPMLVAIKIWAFAHLLANGDLISLLLFGSFLAYAVVDRISVKRRGALGPLGAKSGGLTGDIAAVAIGVAGYLFLLFYGHAWLFGYAPIPALNVYA